MNYKNLSREELREYAEIIDKEGYYYALSRGYISFDKILERESSKEVRAALATLEELEVFLSEEKY